MPLRFFVICYGEQYADMYARVAVHSLTQPRNKAAIPPDAIVSLYSNEATMPRVAEISARLGTVEPHILVDKGSTYDTQNQAFIDEIKRCVQSDSPVVIVQPDCFWGDGSLANLLAIAGEQNVCVASPHIRVDRGLFPEDIEMQYPTDNAQLVSLALPTRHVSWDNADNDAAQSNSYFTGIGIRRISDSLYAVHHLLPTIFYAKLNARDYAYFAEHPDARGMWDHHWPSILAQDGRLRTVACSDAVFIVELTDGETHSTETRPVNPKNHAEYTRVAPHIEMQRNVVAIWRAG